MLYTIVTTLNRSQQHFKYLTAYAELILYQPGWIVYMYEKTTCNNISIDNRRVRNSIDQQKQASPLTDTPRLAEQWLVGAYD
jgi:hypothetical protein